MADCIFCSIASGATQSFKVYEDDFALCFLDINPANPGQVLVIPKKHVQGIHELSPSDVGKLFGVVRLVVLGMSQSLDCGGVNVVYSLGELAGQRVDHLIVYVIPRFKGDKVVVDWERKQGNPDELSKVADKLGKAIKAIPVVVTQREPKVIVEPEPVKKDEVESKPRVPYY